MKDQIDVPLIIDADGKVLLTVENSKKYLQQMVEEEPQVRKASKQCVPPAEENETGEEDELLEDQPGSCLVLATTSQHHPSCHVLLPTFSEQELMSCNVSGQCWPNIEPEHCPNHPAFSEDTNDNAPTSISQLP